MKTARWFVSAILFVASQATGADYVRKSSTDYWYPVILVDVTDGYTPETEKKFGDTTITYCSITDGNAPSSYTDTAADFNEIGDGTGEYRLRIGASEFTSSDKDYLVKIVVSGCRISRFIVHTVIGDVSKIATTDDGGTINVDSGLVQSVLKSWDGNDLTAAAWNTTTNMVNVDVNYVLSDTPLSGSGYSDITQIVRMQLESAIDDDPNAGSVSKLLKDYLTGDAYTRLGSPVGASMSTDIASIQTTVDDSNNALFNPLWGLEVINTAAQIAQVYAGDNYFAIYEPNYGLSAIRTLTADANENTEAVIDAILLDTAAYDTDAEHAAAHWNAATAAYGGAGTYGQAVEDTSGSGTYDVDDVYDLCIKILNAMRY